MDELTEGPLRFAFAPGWNAVKFDKTTWHRHQMGSRLKAMDILATQ